MESFHSTKGTLWLEKKKSFEMFFTLKAKTDKLQQTSCLCYVVYEK